MVTNFRNSALLLHYLSSANLANTTASKSRPARIRFPGHSSYNDLTSKRYLVLTASSGTSTMPSSTNPPDSSYTGWPV